MKQTYDMRIGDVTYKLTSMDARASQEFLDWAGRTMPDPVDEVVACAAKLPADYRDKFLDSRLDGAIERKRLRGSLSDPELTAFCRTVEAATKIVHLLLRPAHPHLTEGDVAELMPRIDAKELDRVQTELDRAATHVPVSEDEAERRYFRGPGTDSKKPRRRADPVHAPGLG